MRIIITLFFIGLGLTAYSQFSDELDKRNGFKDLKLLSDATAYDGIEYWKADKEKPEHAIYRSIKGSYDKIGEVEISKITVYTYRSLIYEIEVITEKDEKLYRSLEKAYGKINSSIAASYSFWDGKNLRLTYETVGSKKIKLTYHSKQIKQMIALDKKKAVDSLSTEF